MQCKNHHDRSGVNTCSKCGEWLCSECTTDLNGQNLCKSCISHTMGSTASTSKAVHASGHSFNSFLLLIFSAVPGANYMYLGLMKKGLFVMSAFFGTIALTSVSFLDFFGLLLPIILITSLFDGFDKKRKLNAGEFVPDNADEIVCFVKEYKFPLIAFLGFAVILNLVEDILWSFRDYFGYSCGGFSGIVSLAIICFGIYFIVKAIGKKGKSSQDKTDNDEK